MSIDIKPHAYDPAANPELFEGVLARRVVAFVIDFLIIAVPGRARGDVHLRLRHRHVRARLGALLAAAAGASVIWAIVYFGLTLGGAALGHHRHAGRWISRCAPGTARRPISCSARCTPSCSGSRSRCFTPFVLLVAFFNERRRLLHDILLGTVVINNAGARRHAASAAGASPKGL